MLSTATLTKARKRLLQMHFESGVGHLGGNLSCLDSLLILYHEYLGQDDRFVLSKGHSAGSLYIVLWSLGVLDDKSIKSFHHDGTILAGHPPPKTIPGIDFATGSLGHGLSLASGVAKSNMLKKNSNKVYCLLSDGEWQEGSTWEALIFLSHHKLNNMVVLVDHNGLQGFGSTHDVASMNPLHKKIEGFNVDLSVIDGHDLMQIRSALSKKTEKCHIIIMNTIKGHGVSFMENQMQSHYLPLNKKQYLLAVKEIEAG